MNTVINFLTHRLAVFLTTILTAMFGWVVTKGYLDAANAQALTQAISAGAVAIAAAGLHSLILTPGAQKVQAFLLKWFGDNTPPTTPPTAALMIVLGGLTMAFLTGCPHAPVATTQPIVVPASVVPTFILAERVSLALASADVAHAHATGNLTGVAYDGALAGLAALRQQIADNAQQAASGGPVNLNDLDNTFNAALTDFTNAYLVSIIPTVPVPAP